MVCMKVRGQYRTQFSPTTVHIRSGDWTQVVRLGGTFPTEPSCPDFENITAV